MKIQFLGASKGVTGSCYYIETDKLSFLVDCGQFQGSIQEEKKNAEPFPFDPSTLDFVILTHAHMDHSGRLPKLTQRGFKGKIFMTRSTANLAEILLKDSAKIHELEASKENEKLKKEGLSPNEPYYTTEDVIYTLPYFYPMDYEHTHEVSSELSFRFINAGHLLGSSHVYIKYREKSFLFSGDIGSKNSAILKHPKPAVQADYLFMETTYGNRPRRDASDRFKKLSTIIKKTIKANGTVIIPSFSVGRTQDIVHGLKGLNDPELNNIPFYIDSPLAIKATDIYEKPSEDQTDGIRRQIEAGKKPFRMENLYFVDDAEESFQLNLSKEPKVLIAASGMCDAGRILNHLEYYLPQHNTTIIFVGYQSKESLGRVIQNGEKVIKIYDKEVYSNANIVTVGGFSGHADQTELLDWIKDITPKRIFLVHGEEESMNTFKELIKDKGDIYIPELYETVEID